MEKNMGKVKLFSQLGTSSKGSTVMVGSRDVGPFSGWMATSTVGHGMTIKCMARVLLAMQMETSIKVCLVHLPAELGCVAVCGVNFVFLSFCVFQGTMTKDESMGRES